MHYTSRKVAGSRSDEVNIFNLILPVALGTGVYSASNINEYQMQENNVSGKKARPVRRAANLTECASCDVLTGL
jgi:hypothetical protein